MSIRWIATTGMLCRRFAHTALIYFQFQLKVYFYKCLDGAQPWCLTANFSQVQTVEPVLHAEVESNFSQVRIWCNIRKGVTLCVRRMQPRRCLLLSNRWHAKDVPFLCEHFQRLTVFELLTPEFEPSSQNWVPNSVLGEKQPLNKKFQNFAMTYHDSHTVHVKFLKICIM